MKVFKRTNISSYLTGLIGLWIWILVFCKILYYKLQLWALITICILMILFWISLIATYQAEYLALLQFSKGVEDLRPYAQSYMVAQFLNVVLFNQAHWFFAFKYWVTSWNVELTKKRMSPNTYDTRLQAVNIVVTLTNVILAAIDWIAFNHRKKRLFWGFMYAGMLPLFFSGLILIWGLQKLNKTMKSATFLIDKGVITWHIIAYFSVVIAVILQSFFQWSYPASYEYTTYCVQVIGLVCSTILAVILNTIITKYIQQQDTRTPSTPSTFTDRLSSANSSYKLEEDQENLKK